ncbi:hypothetical protein TWF696_000839 [Orbilia brochopaga]|uniref:Uncharacterized protein n=1 Tax=Orbilia brochopaga TaxID=3140254 RepID=A0AAV9VCI9_9PEZI
MRRGLRFSSLWLTLLYTITFLSHPVRSQWSVTWKGKIMAMEFNRVFYTSELNDRKAYITGAFCLLDGTKPESEENAVGTMSIQGGVPDSVRNQDSYSVNAWQGLQCEGHKDASQWIFVGNNGTKGTKINENPMGVALHDYAIGQFRNVLTTRCIALIRDKDVDPAANIETVPHAIRSVPCDQTSKDSKQMWVVYFNVDGQPFAPLIPADALGACNAPNTYKDSAGNWKFDRVPGGVYEDTANDDQLRQVDARYVGMSTFDIDDNGGVSPQARCTGMKWVFGPGFSKELLDPNKKLKGDGQADKTKTKDGKKGDKKDFSKDGGKGGDQGGEKDDGTPTMEGGDGFEPDYDSSPDSAKRAVQFFG